jgi:hypothetical protein
MNTKINDWINKWVKRQKKLLKISSCRKQHASLEGSHRGVIEDWSILVCWAVSTGLRLPTLQRRVVKHRRLFDLDNKGGTIIRHIDKCFTVSTAWHPKRLEASGLCHIIIQGSVTWLSLLRIRTCIWIKSLWVKCGVVIKFDTTSDPRNWKKNWKKKPVDPSIHKI